MFCHDAPNVSQKLGAAGRPAQLQDSGATLQYVAQHCPKVFRVAETDSTGADFGFQASVYFSASTEPFQMCKLQRSQTAV